MQVRDLVAALLAAPQAAVPHTHNDGDTTRIALRADELAVLGFAFVGCYNRAKLERNGWQLDPDTGDWFVELPEGC